MLFRRDCIVLCKFWTLGWNVYIFIRYSLSDQKLILFQSCVVSDPFKISLSLRLQAHFGVVTWPWRREIQPFNWNCYFLTKMLIWIKKHFCSENQHFHWKVHFWRPLLKHYESPKEYQWFWGTFSQKVHFMWKCHILATFSGNSHFGQKVNFLIKFQEKCNFAPMHGCWWLLIGVGGVGGIW